MSINIILYQAVFEQIYLQFCFDSYTCIFWVFRSDTKSVNVRLSLFLIKYTSIALLNSKLHKLQILWNLIRHSFILLFSGIYRDKTIWPINYCTFPLMIHKITPSLGYNWLLKRFDKQLNKPTIKVTKVVKPTHKNTFL